MSGKPESPVPQTPSSPSDEALSRRRKLMRAAISGAPLMLSLPTTVSAQVLSSAFRAAQNDLAIQRDPLFSLARVTTGPDGWVRIPARSLIPRGNSTLPALYRIGTSSYSYYLQSTGEAYSSGVDEQLFDGTNVYLLVLFNIDMGNSISGGVPYPLTQTGVGLHRSAWASVNPQGTQGYNGVEWVS